jgi:PAS domain S-box-containing protein
LDQRSWINDLEFQLIRKDGSILPVSLSATAIKDAAGNYLMSHSVVMDISDRKQLEAEHQQSQSSLLQEEERYRYIFESVGISIWEENYSEVKEQIDQLKASGVEDFRQYFLEHLEFVQQAVGIVRLRDVNHISVEMFGASNKAELLTSLHQVFTPKSQSVFLESLVAIANGESHFVAEAEAQTLQGIPLNILLTIAFPPNSESYDRVVVSILDISEGKQIEQERERFLAVGSDLQVITGENGYFHWVSPTFEPTLGWTTEELTSRPWAEFVHPEDVEASRIEAANVLSGQETVAFEHRFRHKDGSYRWLLWKAQSYLEKQLIYGVAVDITESKHTEFILEQQVRREKAIANISQNIHRSLDLKQILSSTVERIGELLQSDRVLIFRFQPDWSGKVVAEFLATGYDSVLNLDVNDPCFGEQYVEPYRQGRVYAIADFDQVKILPCYRRLITKLQVRANLIVPILQGEHLWGLLIAHQCFTPRQWQTEEIELLQHLATQLGIAIQQAELYQKNAQQAALIDIASDAIFVRDLSNQILFWSQGAERLYGWKAAEIQGQEIQHLFHSESLNQLEVALKITISQGNWNGELKQITQDDREIIVESRWTLMRDQQNNPQSILVVNSDITEKKQLEGQLLHAQRIESIGTLAGGIAHDLNNILTPILGFTQLLPLKIPNIDESSLKILELVRNNALRGAEIVKQILLFSRATEVEWELIALNQIIQEVLQLIQSIFPKSILIEEYISPNLWSIQGDSTQLHQVLMNLCVNARDAMPNGGKLIISAENLYLDEQYTHKNLDLKIGNYILLTVIDTGVGIPQNIIDQIFDPFFTTKETGKGTGLGLATVIGIVKNHGGAIVVESEPNSGTQFRVYLPQSETTGETQTTTSHTIPMGQKELILVVDDEASIREVTQANLESYNYRVITARDGIEAIALYAQQPQAIQAILMDLTMPEMDGLTAMRALKKINPAVKLIATSGLATTDKMIAAELIGIKTFLVKPYTAEKLLVNLAEVIAAN